MVINCSLQSKIMHRSVLMTYTNLFCESTVQYYCILTTFLSHCPLDQAVVLAIKSLRQIVIAHWTRAQLVSFLVDMDLYSNH